MFIAMNRFRVTKGSEAAFEQVWLSRDSHLDKVPDCPIDWATSLSQMQSDVTVARSASLI